jgi:hypothetical protein
LLLADFHLMGKHVERLIGIEEASAAAHTSHETAVVHTGKVCAELLRLMVTERTRVHNTTVITIIKAVHVAAVDGLFRVQGFKENARAGQELSVIHYSALFDGKRNSSVSSHVPFRPPF